jgi:hypothetical protein
MPFLSSPAALRAQPQATTSPHISDNTTTHLDLIAPFR